jgi:DNA polymerase II large subunit
LNGTRKTPWQFIIDCDINFDGNEIYVKESIISMPRYLNINLNLVQLISYLISEGYLREKKYCEIVNTDLKIIQEVKKSLEGILKRKLKINWDCRIGKKKCGRIRLPAILRDVLICLGVHPVRSNQKRLPSFLFLLSNEFKEEFLRCYVNGDGHDYKHKNFKMLYSNSEFLSAELSLLAHSLNYKTSINSGKRVNQILYSKYNNTDPWWPLNDFTKELYGALRKEGFVKNEISKMLNNYYKNVRSKSASKFAIKKLIDLLKHKKNKSLRAKMELIYNSDIKVERIRKIRKFKSAYKYVYDLEVPPHQNFLCGPHPIFAHNTMDSPLVLTSVLDPAEIDDQVHGMDVVWKYPLELYEAALEMKNPWEVKVNDKKIEQLGDRLGTEQQYENFGFTHNVDNFNKGIQCSAYKTIPSMELKLFGQMDIARKVRAVDLNDVAKLVIQKHFLKDIKGNLRKFSMQQFRCVKCNEKYRRPPLSGICSNCNGKLIFTISEGSVVKYLGHSLNLSEKYDFSPYLKQTIDVLKENIEKVFGKEKDKQIGLSGFIN